MNCLLYQNTWSTIMLLDSPEDVDLAQILVFSNISIFLGLHWPWKWTKNFKFLVRPISAKIRTFWKILQKLFLPSRSLPSVKIWSRLNHIWGIRVQTLHSPPSPKKRIISWMLNWYKKIGKFLTWQPQMLYQWSLPRFFFFLKSLICQILGS